MLLRTIEYTAFVSLSQGSGSESSVLAGSVDELGLTGSAIGEEKRPGGRKVRTTHIHTYLITSPLEGGRYI